MKKYLFIALAIGLFSCQQETENPTETPGENNTINNKELNDLKAENLDLKHQIAVKDSMYNYYAAYMNDIRTNLDLIQGKQKNLFDKTANPEMLSATDPNIVEDIQELGKLLNDNQAKIAKLKAEIKNNNTQMNAFEEMIISLSEEVEMKNMEIYQLQQEMENMDAAFGELFEAFKEKSETLESTTNELNTAFFAYGTKKELIENNVITTEGGFIGIGKNKELADDFNQDYFTEVNIMDLSEISLGFDKVELITTHPSGSYAFKGDDQITKLVINDPKTFWSVSKYLVMVVK
ncbi:Cbp1 family collagen-binding glycoprotein adhesin [Parvicella tangerina]|uniref:Uncharacterized protein n=1 Tax=Parvicella tangerina TaxID=2829795 RepID=A0A916ND61_9FLAO|nr:hypothetical protein [Parvicella tangerina]CAG5086319.1 hypothetical protein CRYO30217_03081 [Parvicella tangerina]